MGVGDGVGLGAGTVPDELMPPPPPHAARNTATDAAVEFLKIASRLSRLSIGAPTPEPPFASVPFGASSRRHRPRFTRRCRPVSRRLTTCGKTGASVFRPRRALDMHARSPAETGSGRAYGYLPTRLSRLGPPAGEQADSIPSRLTISSDDRSARRDREQIWSAKITARVRPSSRQPASCPHRSPSVERV